MKYHIGQTVYVFVSYVFVSIVGNYSGPNGEHTKNKIKFFEGKIEDCPIKDGFSDKQQLFIRITRRVYTTDPTDIKIGYIWKPSSDENIYLSPEKPTRESIMNIFGD